MTLVKGPGLEVRRPNSPYSAKTQAFHFEKVVSSLEKERISVLCDLSVWHKYHYTTQAGLELLKLQLPSYISLLNS